MNIAVFGLGHVGTVSAAGLSALGHSVVGVDIDPRKVDALRAGRSAVREDGLGDLLATALAAGRLHATVDAARAVAETDAALVCVGTPPAADGGIALDAVLAVSSSIGVALRGRAPGYTVVIRSTVPPGSSSGPIASALELASGGREGVDFHVGAVPEFMREGSAVADFFAPALLVAGTSNAVAASAVESLFTGVEVPVVHCPVAAAELVKYASNAWHALKVTFANEVGALAAAAGVDGAAVMDLFARDTRLNISPAYLRPGFAFGGPCLEKDLAALTRYAAGREVDVPMLASITGANAMRLRRGVERVLAVPGRIALLGLSFKANTGDLRGSPFVIVARAVLDAGRDVRIVEPYAGAAAVSLEDTRFGGLVVETVDAALEECDVVVLGCRHGGFEGVEARLNPRQVFIDLNA